MPGASTFFRAVACATTLLVATPSLAQAPPPPPPGQPPPPPGQPPPPPGYGYGYGYGNPNDPYRLQNAYFMYNNDKKNEGIALLLEFFIPGVGSLYADHVNGALLTWGCVVGGFVLVLWGISHEINHVDDPYRTNDNDDVGGAAILGGIVLVIGGRIYGLYDSYASTRDYNLELRRRLGLEASFAIAPLRAPGGDLVWAPSLQLRF